MADAEQTTQSKPAEKPATEAKPRKRVYMYPGDGKTPGVSVQATSQEEADKLYKTKVKESKS